MPLAPATIMDLNAHVPAGQHIIDRQATIMPRTQAYQEQLDAACENWAVRALQAGAVDPPTVFTDIFLNSGNLGPTADTAYALRGNEIKNTIRDMFGDVHTPLLPPAPAASKNPFNRARAKAIALRNDNRGRLHNWTAAVFELCLEMNGFILSPVPTDYMVCMEYECSADRPMFPNFTHAWLMYKKNRIIQTIPDRYISVSRHHAGHPPHCGFIRRYVTDFHTNQIAIIDSIMANRMQANGNVVGCNLLVDVGTLDLATDMRSPTE